MTKYFKYPEERKILIIERVLKRLKRKLEKKKRKDKNEKF